MNKKDGKSVGALFAELASGINIAHFHHGDDKKMRLCMSCTTIGMLRVVPWTQSGGRGLTPSVHGAPPIMALASGSNLAITLGLNLVVLRVKAGTAKWTGRFAPTLKVAAIPYLQAFTWNPRRVHLLSPETAEICWRCGRTEVDAVGPIVYLKNEETKKPADKQRFVWQDPAAFYAQNEPYKTMKSTNEVRAKDGRDLNCLLDKETTPTSAVVETNPRHQGWHIVVPCTTGKDNKTFDHRQIEFASLTADAVRSKLPPVVRAGRPKGLDGWVEPRRPTRGGGATGFVRAAARLLTATDWAALSAAAYKEMHDSPPAFDVLSGLFWGLRRPGVRLPSRNVAWLVLKLMAIVPPRARVPHAHARFQPLWLLPKRQLDECRNDRSCRSPYPMSLPRGRRLEADLRNELGKNMRKRTPEKIDWAGLCHALDRLLD